MHPALLLAVALSLPPDVQVLVLRSGASIPVKGGIQVKDNRVVFRDAAGAIYSLDASEIDAEATARGAPPEPKAKASPAPGPTPRKLAVSGQEKQRLLQELSLSRGQPAPIRTPTPGPSPSASASPAPAPTPGESEDAWRAKAREARGAVERSKAMLAALARREDELESTLLMLRGHYRDSTLTAQLLELERVRYAYEVEKQNLANAEKAWFDLQEDARKKDILPGWLRD